MTNAPIQETLDVEEVRYVHVWQGADGQHALVTTSDTEYDCRETGEGWSANDDDGRTFSGLTLPDAIRAAMRGIENTEGETA